MSRQSSSSNALNMRPPVSEQEQQKQILGTTAQKIKVKVPNERPDEMERAALVLPQGSIVANNSSISGNMQPN